MDTENFKNTIEELESMSLNPELVQDNKIHFTFKESLYRVKMPNQKELMLAEKEKNAYQVSLVKEESVLTKRQLKKLLKEKGVDIDELEIELKKIGEELCHEYMILAKTIDADTEGIEKSKKKINNIKAKRIEVIEEISHSLTPCVEVQAENYYVSYLTYLCTEKNINMDNNVKWERVWNSFDEYLERGDTDLSNFALGTLTKLLLNTR